MSVSPPARHLTPAGIVSRGVSCVLAWAQVLASLPFMATKYVAASMVKVRKRALARKQALVTRLSGITWRLLSSLPNTEHPIMSLVFAMIPFHPRSHRSSVSIMSLVVFRNKQPSCQKDALLMGLNTKEIARASLGEVQNCPWFCPVWTDAYQREGAPEILTIVDPNFQTVV
mgnify:CR=1 FL=1